MVLGMGIYMEAFLIHVISIVTFDSDLERKTQIKTRNCEPEGREK
jgi:hypothetical protein